jgi:hypothetical protein
MQRKATKNTRGPNADEKKYQAWCKEQPCCVTGARGCIEVHHMYSSTFKHNKVLIGHWACIPLCYDYHRGENGYHTVGQKVWRQVCGNQYAYWLVMHDKYVGEGNNPAPSEVIKAIMDWGR